MVGDGLFAQTDVNGSYYNVWLSGSVALKATFPSTTLPQLDRQQMRTDPGDQFCVAIAVVAHVGVIPDAGERFERRRAVRACRQSDLDGLPTPDRR